MVTVEQVTGGQQSILEVEAVGQRSQGRVSGSKIPHPCLGLLANGKPLTDRKQKRCNRLSFAECPVPVPTLVW